MLVQLTRYEFWPKTKDTRKYAKRSKNQHGCARGRCVGWIGKNAHFFPKCPFFISQADIVHRFSDEFSIEVLPDEYDYVLVPFPLSPQGSVATRTLLST